MHQRQTFSEGEEADWVESSREQWSQIRQDGEGHTERLRSTWIWREEHRTHSLERGDELGGQAT